MKNESENMNFILITEINWNSWISFQLEHFNSMILK